MFEDRLNSLAKFNIQKNIPINDNEVINRFSRQKPRRLKVEDWSK